MFDFYTIVEDVLTEEECDQLIDYFHASDVALEQGYNYAFKPIVSLFTRRPNNDFIKEKLSKVLTHMPEDVIPQRAHIECRTAEHPAHFDDKAGNWGMFTTVLYLNDNYCGGETYIHHENETVKITPKKGSMVAYNGHKYEHGVAAISGMRYSLPVWYTGRPLDFPKGLEWWKS